MSYILEALKRADEQRGASPGGVTPARGAPDARLSRLRATWIIGALGGVAGVVLALAVWTLMPAAPPAPGPSEVAAPAPVAAAAPPVQPAAPVLVPEPEPRVEPPPRAERAARAEPPPRPPRGRAPEPDEARRPRSVAPPPAAVTTPRRDAGVAPPPVEVARPPAEVVRPPAAPLAAGSDLKALAAKLSLQVLSWAPDPKDRFVFVSGRKYAEGESIDDKLLVERITEDGVVLSFQGERLTLKGPR